jgi:hypothetical protein
VIQTKTDFLLALVERIHKWIFLKFHYFCLISKTPKF